MFKKIVYFFLLEHLIACTKIINIKYKCKNYILFFLFYFVVFIQVIQVFYALFIDFHR